MTFRMSKAYSVSTQAVTWRQRNKWSTLATRSRRLVAR